MPTDDIPSLGTRCRYCDGTGLMPGLAEIECPACHGTGEVHGTTCLGCGGSGCVEVETEVLCEKCGGVGYKLPN